MLTFLSTEVLREKFICRRNFLFLFLFLDERGRMTWVKRTSLICFVLQLCFSFVLLLSNFFFIFQNSFSLYQGKLFHLSSHHYDKNLWLCSSKFSSPAQDTFLLNFCTEAKGFFLQLFHYQFNLSAKHTKSLLCNHQQSSNCDTLALQSSASTFSPSTTDKKKAQLQEKNRATDWLDFLPVFVFYPQLDA